VASVLDAMGNLHVQHDTEKRAKRHQPLALLWAIGEACQHAARLTGWPAARERIGALIQEFGVANKDHAYPPFLAPAGTDLRELTITPPRGVRSSGRRRWLNNQNPPVKGGLTLPIYDLFSESTEAATEAALFLLDTYFDDMAPAQSLQVLKATGLRDLPGHSGNSESPATAHSPQRSRKGGAGRLADTALRIAIERLRSQTDAGKAATCSQAGLVALAERYGHSGSQAARRLGFCQLPGQWAQARARKARLIYPDAASRQGLPHGGSTRLYGGSSRRQGQSGLVRGVAAAVAGTSGRQREAVIMPAR
jgi:hypothetical protein